jgi:2-oxoglutarate ferredoxin oxidoreductase subunit alpha
MKDDGCLVLGGEAGAGVQTVEAVLTRTLKRSGYHVFATREYMSRVRGGSNSTEIRVSSRRVGAYIERIDLLLPLDPASLGHLASRIGPETAIVGERSLLGSEREVIDAPFVAIAEKIGGKIFAGSVAAGVAAGLFSADQTVLGEVLRGQFAAKGDETVRRNLAAARQGYDLGQAILASGKVAISLTPDDTVRGEPFVDGGEAVGMGALAGGCTFVSSYPMTPSTPVLTFLAGRMREFPIVVEQAEDEISAVNMALGAWYAGARGMVTTSGGGFALMVEGVSLAGMIESPLVIHLAQRPGPATGLPTRTEQGDLLFALFAGHGEFPRILLAPGDIEEAFALTRHAFALAERHQVPVIILTDHYLIDSARTIAGLPIGQPPPPQAVVPAGAAYRRYAVTPDGVSPRAIPGGGEGLVVVDSDEHDEEGHITEDLGIRKLMVEKRLRKGAGIEADALGPLLIGPERHRTLLVAWGSTKPIITEALAVAGRDDVACLHCPQVAPLHPEILRRVKEAERTVVIEGNATGQFARWLAMNGARCDDAILKYDGMSFSVEGIAAAILSLP